jgi:predicted nucleotidyltransferase
MKTFGETIRNLREEKSLPLRTVAAYLDIDQAILSKVERGIRKSTRLQVVSLAAYYEVDSDDLLASWLADKVLGELENEDMALRALKVAEEIVLYGNKETLEKSKTLRTIEETLFEDGRVARAWIFGSFARGEARKESDIDLMVELKTDKAYSMFDLLDISHRIETKIGRTIDLVEKGYLKDFAQESAQNDLIKIYG